MTLTRPAAAALLAFALSAAAQTPPPKPPIAVYWMSVETAAGPAVSVPSAMAGMLPPGMQGGKRMRLDLGSLQAPRGEARATHAIPPEAALGEKLPLVTPKGEARAAPSEGTRQPQPMERPKGRMLIYWGCGDSVRPGQPVVVDFSKMDGKDAGRALRSVDVARPQPPAPGPYRSYGTWPNEQSQQRIADKASLRGLHFVSGSYTPDIQFSIDAKHDFMEPIEFAPARRSDGGGLIVNWKTVPNALGYFATAMGQGEKGDDVVMWSSSESQEMGHALLDFIPPPEVERLVKEKVILASSTNSCTVPAGIFRDGATMLNFIAYGEELNLLHPPRPKDPKEKWEPLWGVKVRLKSTASTLLAEGSGSKPAAQSETQGRGNVLNEGINVLRGIFGR
jgi:hypothetical protein